MHCPLYQLLDVLLPLLHVTKVARCCLLSGVFGICLGVTISCLSFPRRNRVSSAHATEYSYSYRSTGLTLQTNIIGTAEFGSSQPPTYPMRLPTRTTSRDQRRQEQIGPTNRRTISYLASSYQRHSHHSTPAQHCRTDQHSQVDSSTILGPCHLWRLS
jgi:hypothetical protein